LLARTPVEGRAVDVDDVAEDPRHPGALVVPREELKSREVRSGEDVGLLGAREAVDRAAVEGHALVERILEFRGGDVERLVASQHVGEPQLDEANAALLDGSQYVLSLALHMHHSRTFPSVALLVHKQRNPPHSRGGFRSRP